jgi:hypothetical protein
VNTRAARPAPEFDASRPHPARIYDFLLDGKDNYAVDREAAGTILAVAPEVRDMARANRAFLARAVRYLARDAGIRQFLDIGTGIPTEPNTHEVAQQAAPGSRVVYVDNDPVVLAHARALLNSGPYGQCAYVNADLRDPGKILGQARTLLDFSRPVGLLLVAVLHFIPDDDGPASLAAAYRDALPPGSFLVISHGTADFHDAAVAGTAAAAYDKATAPLVLRPRPAIAALFGGATLVPPGLVQAPLWRPDTGQEPANLDKIGIYAGVAAT